MVSRNKARTVFVVGGGSGDVSSAVILTPGSSSRNVIKSSGNFVELTVKAAVGQTASLLIGQNEDGDEVFRISPSGDVVVDGVNLSLGNPNFGNVFATFDKSDSMVSRRGGIALYAQTDDTLQQVQVFGDAGMAPDGTQHVARFAGNSLFTQPGGWEFTHEDDKSQINVTASAAQTAPLLDLRDVDSVSVHRLGETNAGFFGVSPVTQRALITNPTGGAIIDAESRTAITAINTLLKAYGLEAAA